MANKDFGIFFWVHLLIIIFWHIGPFLVSWYFILIGVLLSYAQRALIGGCILTHAQLRNGGKKTFRGYYLEKLGIKVKSKTMRVIFPWIEPAVIFLIAILWQVTLGKAPLLF
jgi:hypothetical protein